MRTLWVLLLVAVVFSIGAYAHGYGPVADENARTSYHGDMMWHGSDYDVDGHEEGCHQAYEGSDWRFWRW